MHGITDIPDWCEAECNPDSSRDYETYWKKSPLCRFLQTKRMPPTLFLLGQNDKRVPPSQSFELYYQLKLLGIKTQ